MARTYARINVAVWENEDFVALSPAAKLLYFHIISRRDVSSVGSLVIRDRVWARQVFNGDVDAIWSALLELETGRYVFVDAETSELLIRTFLRHDNSPHINWKHTQAIVSAAARLDSEVLRDIAEGFLDDLPQQDNAQPIGQSNGQSVDQPDGQPIHLEPEAFNLEPDACIPNPISQNPPPRGSNVTPSVVADVAWLAAVRRAKNNPGVKAPHLVAPLIFDEIQAKEMHYLTAFIEANPDIESHAEMANAYEDQRSARIMRRKFMQLANPSDLDELEKF